MRDTLRRVQRGIDLSAVLPGLLKAKGWSQAQLGEKAGISREDINAMCRAENPKTVGDERLRRIAKALKTTPEALRAAAEAAAETAPLGRELDSLLALLQEAAEDGTPFALAVRALELQARRLDVLETLLGVAGRRAIGG